MKVLLDECIPRKLKNSLGEHECQTVPEVGWAGQKNGRLLSLAERSGFHLFITMDKASNTSRIWLAAVSRFSLFAPDQTAFTICCHTWKHVDQS